MISNDRKKRYFSLIGIKDNGGLVYPSDDIVKIIVVCEKYFLMFVAGTSGQEINASKKMYAKLHHTIVTELSTTRPGKILFESLLQHDINTHTVREDFHSTQIMKSVVTSYLKIRLLRYAQEYTKSVVKKDVLGKRQELTKMMLFKGL